MYAVSTGHGEETTFGSATSSTNDPDERSPDNAARRVNLPKGIASRTCGVNERSRFLIGTVNAWIGQSLSRWETLGASNTPHPRGSRLCFVRPLVLDGSPQETDQECMRYKESNKSASTS